MQETLQKLILEPAEKRAPVLPSGTASILILVGMAFSGILGANQPPLLDYILGGYCTMNIFYIGYFHLFTILPLRLKSSHIRIFIGVESASSLLAAFLFPRSLDPFLGSLMVFLSISLAIITVRSYSLLYLVSAGVGLIIIHAIKFLEMPGVLMLAAHCLIAGVAVEAIQKLKSITRGNINRLEIINEFSRKINSTLDTQQVFSLLGSILQKTFEADTYFIGVLQDSKLEFKLFLDDGEDFSGMQIDPNGTLSGWIIENQCELFLPDLRGDLSITGVQEVVIGREKTNLSWMGVPLSGQHIKGVMAIASYRPNAFDRSDLELMNNMVRHAVLALDNSYRHAEVEEQSHLDSLTGVYNHGYFLHILRQNTSTPKSLALIMLDIDYFKQYNDTYGHIQGDQLLTAICSTIKQHVKRVDFVGRWGGEEFAIGLPGATGRQAHDVALRIHDSLAYLVLLEPGPTGRPALTASQGIAQFPEEATETMKLIELADHRLYVAKERGRNQIEPPASQWDQLEGPRGTAPSGPADSVV